MCMCAWVSVFFGHCSFFVDTIISCTHRPKIAPVTTLVSPLHQDGSPRSRTDTTNGEGSLHSGRNGRIPNSQEREDGHGWWSWLRRSEVAGQFLQGLAKARAQSVPWILQERVEAAWIRRWSCILACNAARAFATSLLERRPTPGTGSEVPSVNEVLRDARFV